MYFWGALLLLYIVQIKYRLKNVVCVDFVLHALRTELWLDATMQCKQQHRAAPGDHSDSIFEQFRTVSKPNDLHTNRNELNFVADLKRMSRKTKKWDSFILFFRAVFSFGDFAQYSSFH